MMRESILSQAEFPARHLPFEFRSIPRIGYSAAARGGPPMPPAASRPPLLARAMPEIAGLTGALASEMLLRRLPPGSSKVLKMLLQPKGRINRWIVSPMILGMPGYEAGSRLGRTYSDSYFPQVLRGLPFDK